MKEESRLVYRAENVKNGDISVFWDLDTKKERRSVLLHSCCGPCSTACIERLAEDYRVTVFYYNPNITERDEYEKRKQTQIDFIKAYNEKSDEEHQVGFIEGEYIAEDYLEAVKDLETEPEGGMRCTECFKLRLERTADAAIESGFTLFGTTLTVSPHKNYPLISMIGNEIAKQKHIAYLDMDFKKKDGYKRSVELSKEYGLYRQNYCGCVFSNWTLTVNQR